MITIKTKNIQNSCTVPVKNIGIKQVYIKMSSISSTSFSSISSDSSDSSSSASDSTDSASTQQNDEISAVVPDKEQIISDMKAFMSHHEIATALEKKKLKERENELTEAKIQIDTLNTKILHLENRAEILWKKNAEFKMSNFDLSNQIQTTTAQDKKFKTSLKEKEEEISYLEQQVEELSEFKQKVELAQRIFKTPIKNINLNTNAQQNETNLASSDPSKANDESGAETRTGTKVGAFESDSESESESESESPTSKQHISTRSLRAKRRRPSC